MTRALVWSVAPMALLVALVVSETARMIIGLGTLKIVLAVLP